jgi:hypothetical protein
MGDSAIPELITTSLLLDVIKIKIKLPGLMVSLTSENNASN